MIDTQGWGLSRAESAQVGHPLIERIEGATR